MNRLRNSKISNHIPRNPIMKKKASRARMYEQEYGQEFEIQPRMDEEHQEIYNSYGLVNRPRLDQKALLEKYGSREHLNIYGRKDNGRKQNYRHVEYHY